jgi:hypothetical protein
MSENPVPYNTDKSKRPSYVAIAGFLDGYLHRELLMDITAPDKFNKNYSELTDEEQEEFFEYVFHILHGEAFRNVQDYIGRSLSNTEDALIKKRIVLFLMKQGFNYYKT